jgi:hypothetical protein
MMLTYHQREVKRLFKDILLGKDSQDLTLMIKGPSSTEDKRYNNRVQSYERRKNPLGREAVVSSPETRLLKPTSRSLQDVWVIIYRNRTIAEGPFEDIAKTLQEVPKEIVAPAYGLVTRLLAAAGAVSLLALSFAVGDIAAYSKKEPALIVLEDRLEKIEHSPKPDVTKEFSGIQSSLDTILDRQETIKSLITLRMLKSAPSAEKVVSPVSAVSMVNNRLKEADLRQLVDLETRRQDLIMKDDELAQRGFLPPHVDRQNIASAIGALDQKISMLKQKYNIPSRD